MVNPPHYPGARIYSILADAGRWPGILISECPSNVIPELGSWLGKDTQILIGCLANLAELGVNTNLMIRLKLPTSTHSGSFSAKGYVGLGLAVKCYPSNTFHGLTVTDVSVRNLR